MNTTIDYDILLKFFASIIGILGVIYQLRNLKITFKSSIKTDLEILNMLEETDPNFAIVKKSVTESIKKRYSKSNRSLTIYSITDFILGIIFVFGFGYWTFYLSYESFSFWSLLTGQFAIAGLGGILSAFDKKEKIQIK